MYEPLIEEIGNLRGAIANLERKAVERKDEPDSEDVYVKNLDEIEVYLKRELGAVAKLLNGSLIKIANKTTEVGKAPNMIIPDTVEISNLKELTTAVGALNTMIGVLGKRLEKMNPIINVSSPDVNIPEIKLPTINIPEIRIPEIKVPEVRIEKDSILFDISRLIDALKPLQNISSSPKKPIAVRLSDGNKFLQEFLSVVKKGNEQLATVVSTSYGLTKDEFIDAMARIGYNRTGYSGVKALSNGTAVQIVASSTPCKKVEISVTGGTVAVGFDNTVLITSGSEVGVICYPGNLPYVIETDNLTRIWVSGANGRRVCFNYYV